ncbi:hypothetical protein AB0F44_01075 [Nocardioides sp. NPDC023903]|uniref:hypothetical protein n=1 Tax=Nocardioides sp. NPDC023903 TaxID=3157195 RepID=UPI0033D922E6
MDPAWISAGSGLVGAFVGACAALSGKWIDARHARKAEQRRQTDELLVRFWEIADRMWRLSEEGHFTIRTIDNLPVGEPAMPGAPPVSEEDHSVLAQQVRDAYRAVREAEIEAGVLLGRMRLLSLPIAEYAVALRDASVHYHYNRDDDAFSKRAAAVAAYEAAASRFITS